MGALFDLQGRLEVVQARATDAAWKHLRATLWRLSNRRGVNHTTGRSEATYVAGGDDDPT